MNEIIDREKKLLIEKHPELFPLLQRLDGITGFISILGDDPRVNVFQRSKHVHRVVWFTDWLCDRFPSHDRNEAMLIAWCHDLNRLPFAHNLEKSINFDQSKNIPSYFSNFNVNLPRRVVDGIQQMLSKDSNGLKSARLAYAADAIAGFIEDPLFAITALEIPLDSIPKIVREHLGFDVNDKSFCDRLDNLKVLFQTSSQKYEVLFDEIVFEYGVKFLKRHNDSDILFVDLPTFNDLRETLKENFLRTEVFPINNEKVSHGWNLANEIGIPLIESLSKTGIDPYRLFLSLTDRDMLQMAVTKNLVVDFEPYFPSIPLTHQPKQSLLTELAKKILENDPALRKRELSGGLSGGSVFLVDAKLDTPIVIKIGSTAQIEHELDGRCRYSEQDERVKDMLSWLSNHGLNGVSEEISLSTNGQGEKLKAVAYRYFGASSYSELEQYVDFREVFEDFCGARVKVTEFQLRSFLHTLLSKFPDPILSDDSVGSGLENFLPDVRWDRSVEPILNTAAAFVGEGADELANLKTWWLKKSTIIKIAAWPVHSLLHGDLRFANVLVNLLNSSDIEIIDFGNVVNGHVLQDLAKFECDLLFRISPMETVFENKPWSMEEIRLRTLQYAFTSDFLCENTKESGPTNYTQLEALKTLRSVYNEKFNIGVQPGRFDMYRWFLLAEVLRRLTWFEKEFTQKDARRALVYSVLLLKRSIDSEINYVPCFIAAEHLIRELGVRAAYVATKEYRQTINDRRNTAKILAIKKAAEREGTVKLIAETGHSYLSARRPFFADIERLLEKGKLEIVLSNRAFLDIHAISAAYGQPNFLNDLELHEDVLGKMSQSFAGFNELKQSSCNIELRISPYGLPATILLTDNVVFFEPYFRVHRDQRARHLFNSFEMEMTDNNVLQLMKDNFDFFWEHSIPLEQFLKQEDTYKSLLKKWIDELK